MRLKVFRKFHASVYVVNAVVRNSKLWNKYCKRAFAKDRKGKSGWIDDDGGSGDGDDNVLARTSR